MTIVRVNKRDRYVTMDKTGLEDPRLSFKVKGLLAYLLSKPDNWTAKISHLKKVGPDGRHAVKTALQDLEEYGYLVREERRNDKGQYAGVECIIYEIPQPTGMAGNSPDTENPDSDNPKSDNRHLMNNDLMNYELTNEEEKGWAEKIYQILGYGINDGQLSTLRSYADFLSPEVISFALDKAAEYGANSWRYILVVLEDWKKSKVDSITKAKKFLQNEDEEHVSNRENSKVRGKNSYEAKEGKDDPGESYFEEVKETLKKL